MAKRILSIILALCMVFGICAIASADEAPVLRFDENGEFKILHLCDCQDGYPADKRMFAYINTVLETYEPDLVILGGDNTVGEEETKELAVEELVKPFVDHKIPFTLVFGNHDYQQGYTNDELFEMYKKYGKEYCVAYDAVPELHGTATHNLPILASKSDDIKFNLWMFDSGAYVDGGYDCVRKDQIDWYKETSDKLAEKAGGKVPSMAFQHIIVGEVYDRLFAETPIALGEITREFNGKIYSFFPKLHNFEGFLIEYPCPGVDNEGQFDAMVEQGDMLAVFSGHDHPNSFITELDGVKIINTPSPTYNSYSSIVNKGSRLITIKEDDNWNFTTELITYNDLVINDPDFAAEIGESKAVAMLYNFLGDLALALTKVASIFSKILLG
ncbi:MAG: metallophosphoesterase [Clostridia bacterium]|nr:metallophosphoesterase [Clostridia bacterium]